MKLDILLLCFILIKRLLIKTEGEKWEKNPTSNNRSILLNLPSSKIS